MTRPMLDGIELLQVQKVEADDQEVLAQHGVPALEGDFLQDLGRRVTRVSLTGVMTGPEASDQLKTLRNKFRSATPVPFVADIATATKVGKVLIEEFGVRDLAGKPERFEYELTLREFLPPPKPEQEEPPPAPEPPLPKVETGTLVVEVIVEGVPDFDFGRISVSAEGTLDDGSILKRTLTNRSDNVWTDENMPLGEYKVKAVETNPLSASELVSTTILAAQTSKVNISLSPGAIIARAFIVHFRFNSAFVEPCMRALLSDVAQFAKDNDKLKLVIVGHTDKTDIDKFNQSLSERRGRSVFAYLTFGRDKKASLAEWNGLRLKRPPGTITSNKDSWGVREYQHILQDLRFYSGNVDGDDGDLTKDAVRAFRCRNGLPPGTTVDDATWNKLIERYLEQDSLAVPRTQFLPNGSDILKWLGCGEESPLPLPKPTTQMAFRPYRRVELLFVNAAALPCTVPQPDTFELPEKGAVGPSWELGPGDLKKHCCFATRDCSKATAPNWCIELAEPTTMTFKGSIKSEDGTPFAKKKFVIITPDGEFVRVGSDGKIKEGEQSNGEPILSVTNDTGEFTIPDKRVGVYSLEVREKVVVRLFEKEDKDAKGNAVCKTLKSDKDELKVVVLSAPVLREIRLPVVVHLMRALRPDSREMRTCADASAPGGRRQQETSLFAGDDKAVADLFEEVNKVWKQARVRFNVVDIVREAFAHPVLTECNVAEDEFKFILKNCGYPEAVNVFFFGSLEGLTEIGFGISEEGGVELGRGGCGIGDRGGGLVLGPPQRTQIVAHELGHFLNLNHTDADSRLMLRGTFTGLNRTIVQTKKEPEVDTARASKGARLDCLPLKLNVTGTGFVQVGGSLSHEFIIVENPFDKVTVEAVISDELLAVGTLTMEGGEGTSNRVRTVDPSVHEPPVEIKAVYTPNSGGEPIATRVVIRIVDFSLDVVGAKRRASGEFFASPHPTDVVTIVAKIDPFLEPTKPNCVPTTLVKWTKGNEHPDPLRHTVSRAKVSTTTVKAKIADVEFSRTIEIREVLLVDNKSPFDTGIDLVEIEGILNQQLTLPGKRIAQANLFKEQKDSLFRARASVAGIAGNAVTAILISSGPDGKELDRTPNLTLTRVTGDDFLSNPILSVPEAIKKAELSKVTFTDFNVIRAQAGGKIRLQRIAVVTDPAESSEVKVKGRVLHVAAQTFVDAKTTSKSLKATAVDIRRQIGRANRIWAQAGIEIKERPIQDSVPDPKNLLILDHEDPFTKFTKKERVLLGLDPGGPVYSAVATDLNVFYLQEIQGPPLGLSFKGVSAPGHVVTAIEGPGVSDITLAHEIGHQMLVGWNSPAGTNSAGDEHVDLTGKPWPETNVLHEFDVNSNGDVDLTQVQNILAGVGAGPFVIFEQ